MRGVVGTEPVSGCGVERWIARAHVVPGEVDLDRWQTEERLHPGEAGGRVLEDRAGREDEQLVTVEEVEVAAQLLGVVATCEVAVVVVIVVVGVSRAQGLLVTPASRSASASMAASKVGRSS